jgi:hypothetical protein
MHSQASGDIRARLIYDVNACNVQASLLELPPLAEVALCSYALVCISPRGSSQATYVAVGTAHTSL